MLEPIKELNQALQADFPFELSANIFKMFVAERDYGSPFQTDQSGLPIDKNPAWKRFYKAVELYKNVRDKNQTEAIFYRINDRDKVVIPQFKEALREILEHFKQQAQSLQKESTREEIINILNDLKKQTENPLNHAKQEIINLILNLPELSGLITKDITKIKNWFKTIKDQVLSLAKSFFYGNSKFKQSYDCGEIYGPGNVHNWGVNAAWALSVTKKCVPIKIRSSLTNENMNRSHPNPQESHNPSAFALEIAIAVKMQYGLHINNEIIKLLPPSSPASAETTGEPGNGSIPSKEETIKIFQQCMEAQKLYVALQQGEQSLETKLNVIYSSTSQIKGNFVDGMELLRKGGSLQPILNALSLKAFQGLINLLDSEQFYDVFYYSLKKDIKEQKHILTSLEPGKQAQTLEYKSPVGAGGGALSPSTEGPSLEDRAVAKNTEERRVPKRPRDDEEFRTPSPGKS